MDLSFNNLGKTTENLSGSINLNDVKDFLFTRDTDKQIKVLKHIISASNNSVNSSKKNAFCESLINSDFVEILCESMSTLNLSLLERTFECLKIFIEYKSFFVDNHSPYVVESLLRTLHILCDQENVEDTIICGLGLLNDLNLMIQHFDLDFSCISTSEPTILLLGKLMRMENEKLINPSAELALTLLNLLQVTDLRCSTFLSTIYHSFKRLRIVHSVQRDPQSMRLLSEMASIIIKRLLSESESNVEQLSVEVFVFLKKDVINFIKELNFVEVDTDLLVILFQSLLSMYSHSNLQKISEFSNVLVNHGFLGILALAGQTLKKDNIFKISRSLILETLCQLSRTVLGKANWKHILETGLYALPADFKEWPFAMDTDDLRIPATVSALICSRTLQTNSEKLIKFLNHEKLEIVFTQHPCLLRWTFSTPYINFNLQLAVMCLWIKNDDKYSIAVLKKLLLSHSEMNLSLMKVIECSEDDEVVKKACKIMLNYIDDDASSKEIINEIRGQIWEFLPKILVENIERRVTVTSVLLLCSKLVPEELDLSLLLKIFCQLPRAISKYVSPSEICCKPITNEIIEEVVDCASACFNFMGILLEIVQAKDYKTGMSTMYANSNFLYLLQEALVANDYSLKCISLKLALLLLEHQHKFWIESAQCVELTSEVCVELLANGYVQMGLALRLITVSLEQSLSSLISPVVQIVFPHTQSIRLLYVHLHMIYMKCDKRLLPKCWLCLLKLFVFADKFNLQKHLASLPFTCYLLGKCEPKTEAWEAMLEFLRLWIEFLPPPGSHQSLAVPHVPTALAKFVSTALELSDFASEPLLEEIFSKVIRMGAVPSHIKSSLRSKIISFFI